MNTLWRKLAKFLWPWEGRNYNSVPIRNSVPIGNKTYLFLSYSFSCLEYILSLTVKNYAKSSKYVQSFSTVLWISMGKIRYISRTSIIAELILNKIPFLCCHYSPRVAQKTCMSLSSVFGLGHSAHKSLFARRGKVSWTLHHCRSDYN